MKDQVVIFIDQIAPKNRLQVQAIQQFGFQPRCFVNLIRQGSETYFNHIESQQLLEARFAKRLKQVFTFFRKNRKHIHHVELYPGGRFSFIYILIAKLFFLKTLCIERGDLIYYHRNGYSTFTRFSMWCCYRFSTMIWYRELYMKPILEKIRKNGLFFLHNALDSRERNYDPSIKKDIDFLWLNRVVPERKYQWFLNIMREKPFLSTNNYLVGVNHSNAFTADQEYVINNKPPNLQLADYTNDPVAYFRRARFFVLPADAVFANNALLEAMSYGVIPLISDQQGADLIVDDHINGFIFEHTEQGMRKAMKEALELTSAGYQSYAINATQKIKQHFSEHNYISSLKELYTAISKR